MTTNNLPLNGTLNVGKANDTQLVTADDVLTALLRHNLQPAPPLALFTDAVEIAQAQQRCARCQGQTLIPLSTQAHYCWSCRAVTYCGNSDEHAPEQIANMAILHLADCLLAERIAFMQRIDDLELALSAEQSANTTIEASYWHQRGLAERRARALHRAGVADDED